MTDDADAGGRDGARDGEREGDGEGDADGTVRLWLVDRRFRDENLVTLVYATADGRRHVQKQLSHQLLRKRQVTAAIDADPDAVEPVPDPDDRDRYATQATEMAATHDPDDEV